MTEEQKARAMEIWQRACAAHEDAAAPGDSLRDNVIAGDQAAASVIDAALAERDAEVERLREAIDRDAARFDHCARMIENSFKISGTLRVEQTIKATHYALEARQALTKQGASDDE